MLLDLSPAYIGVLSMYRKEKAQVSGGGIVAAKLFFPQCLLLDL